MNACQNQKALRIMDAPQSPQAVSILLTQFTKLWPFSFSPVLPIFPLIAPNIPLAVPDTGKDFPSVWTDQEKCGIMTPRIRKELCVWIFI